MLSFLNLAPETRMTVYDFLLQSAFMSNKRISYISDNALHQRDPPGAVRYKLTFRIRENHLTLKGNNAIKKQNVANAECNIHLADIDDLLGLANTCRLLRSELLALAWSNADISITSPALLSDLHYIFIHRLSSNACAFIRTLQIKIEDYAWSSRDMKQVVGLVHNRLPRLEELVLNCPIRAQPSKRSIKPRNDSLVALRGLPREVTVSFHCWRTQHRSILGGSGDSSPMPKWSKNMDAHFKNIRYGLDMKSQKRRDEQARKEQGDQIADILGATVELRSLGMT
ncbi:hypothetical protein KCU62_g7796, partial [Aureobasidium sp. EXF-3399]